MQLPQRAGTRRTTAIVGTVAVIAALASAVPVAAAELPPPDGATAFTAAASCWELKQSDPEAADGVYWLVTPHLGAPEQFYCDMTTDGGGWVLIGRGREGWRTNYEGSGSPAQVRDVVTGPDAFTPRQLSARTVDGLLDGGRVDAMTDPIRLRRAADAAGSTWQEGRFRFVSRDRWVWSFPAEHRVAAWTLGTGDGSTGSGGQTNSFGNDNQFRRVQTTATRAQGWTHGWAYGSSVTGTNDPDTYLWSQAADVGAARPFTQLFIRPRLRLADLDFPEVPDSGTPAQELQPLLANGALPGAWGVTGLANGRNTELAPEVSAFAQIGDLVYVGGNFSHVQRGQNATGADRVEQSYLAAFDVETGAWVPDFRPTFNEQVKSLAALPDGTLVVGGEFTEANGQPAVGAVRLVADTGATASGWQPWIENRMTGGSVAVRALDVQDDWLYIGGSFTHVGSSAEATVFARMGARLAAASGEPDANWNPDLNGSVIDLDVGSDGSRLYAAGYFTEVAGAPANKAAALQTAPGAGLVTTPWAPVWSSATDYQQAIVEVGDRLWVGGSEHGLFSFDRDTFTRLSGNITKHGGDFQTLAAAHGVVYGSCHCNEWNYSNAFTWRNVGTDWTQADKIGFAGAWDAATGQVLPDFNPIMQARGGRGPWATFEDSRGNVWFGGDLVRAVRADGRNQWVGGFVRFAPRDTAAPSKPGPLTITAATSDAVELAWGPSNDADGSVTYEVLLEGRVVATTSATSISLPSPGEGVRLFVRARDEIGNRSASTTAATVPPPPEDTSVELVAAGSSWRWRYEQGAWPAGWTTVGFDDAAWSTGDAVLGFGSAGLGTDIDKEPPTSNRPISAQFRRTFEVEDASALTSVTVTTRGDDGVVVYVNGVEVGRDQMPDGSLHAGSYPLSARRTSEAAANPVTFVVPASLVQDGVNVVSASTHLGWRATPDVSFDLSMTAS